MRTKAALLSIFLYDISNPLNIGLDTLAKVYAKYKAMTFDVVDHEFTHASTWMEISVRRLFFHCP